jgi:hypothetical protein
MTLLVQRVHLSFKTASRATKIFSLLLNKLQKYKQSKTITREHVFVITFLGEQYVTVFLTQKLNTFISDEAWFHLIGYSNAQNNSYCSSINPTQNFELPLSDQKIRLRRVITTQRIQRPVLFNGRLNQSGISVTLSGPFLRSLGNKKEYGYLIQARATTHTH